VTSTTSSFVGGKVITFTIAMSIKDILTGNNINAEMDNKLSMEVILVKLPMNIYASTYDRHVQHFLVE
jgi:hypothetical protein